MPTYDYQCDACGHTFEEWQSFHDAELTKCPQCKKKKLRRLMGAGAAIIFKGGGFYETDYRSESYKSGEKAAAEAAKPPEKADDKAAETPAPAAAEKPAKKAKANAKQK